MRCDHDNNCHPSARRTTEPPLAATTAGPRSNRWPQRVWYAVAFVLLLGGCAGYQIGTRSLYAPNITTVYVPMFESDSFRPYLGQWLTEAVVKQIELKTPYKVVDSVTADSLLTGRILAVKKSVQIEDPYDNPRDITVDFKIEVSWVDRHGGLIRPPTSIALPATLIHFGQTSSLVPEGGQSIATANQEAIAGLAEQIVSTMEVPW
jgi:hypothetical protein